MTLIIVALFYYVAVYTFAVVCYFVGFIEQKGRFI